MGIRWGQKKRSPPKPGGRLRNRSRHLRKLPPGRRLPRRLRSLFPPPLPQRRRSPREEPEPTALPNETPEPEAEPMSSEELEAEIQEIRDLYYGIQYDLDSLSPESPGAGLTAYRNEKGQLRKISAKKGAYGDSLSGTYSAEYYYETDPETGTPRCRFVFVFRGRGGIPDLSDGRLPLPPLYRTGRGYRGLSRSGGLPGPGDRNVSLLLICPGGSKLRTKIQIKMRCPANGQETWIVSAQEQEIIRREDFQNEERTCQDV